MYISRVFSVFDGKLSKYLRHVISNAAYYGPVLFTGAIELVTSYIYQEPSQLQLLQDKGLTEVIMEALLVREVR